MLQFPPMPTWDSFHPIVIHFPIVLLLLCPLFVVMSAVLRPPKGRPYMIVALIVLLLGTGSLFIAASTGEAAADLVERGGALNAVLDSHQRLASETKIVFSGLSVVLLGIFAFPRLRRRQETRLSSTYLPIAFLALYTLGLGLVVNTAHAGGRLVHEFGVHAMMPDSSDQSSVQPDEGTSANTADIK
jgi:uncharacterized membrane protein